MIRKVMEAIYPGVAGLDIHEATVVACRRRLVAENLLAELGPDLATFPTAEQLVSWAALCPGKDQSGNKRRSHKTGKGNRWLKRVLTEAAWAATWSHKSY